MLLLLLLPLLQTNTIPAATIKVTLHISPLANDGENYKKTTVFPDKLKTSKQVYYILPFSNESFHNNAIDFVVVQDCLLTPKFLYFNFFSGTEIRIQQRKQIIFCSFLITDIFRKWLIILIQHRGGAP